MPWRASERLIDRACLLGCAAGIFLLIAFGMLGIYADPRFWGIAVLAGVVLFFVFRAKIRRDEAIAATEIALREAFRTEVNALSLEEAKARLLPLLQDTSIVTVEPAFAPVEDPSEYPPNVSSLFAQYARIAIGTLQVGTALHPQPYGTDLSAWTVPKPYMLIGLDEFNEDQPLVVTSKDEAICILENADEADINASFESPSIYHLLLAHALYARDLASRESSA